MTPEEKAVIDAAITWAHRTESPTSHLILEKAVQALIYACPQCNTDTHRCPGCGESIGHTATDCGKDCTEDPMNRRTATTYPCWECLNPGEDPAPWCNCRPGEEPCEGPCRHRAHEPEDCPNVPRTWEPTTLLYCLAGDHIRIGQDESDVLRSSSGAWHAHIVSSVLPSGKTWDKVTPWEHMGLRLDLSANPGFQEYLPNVPCEISCTAERKAILLLMTRLDAKPVDM